MNEERMRPGYWLGLVFCVPFSSLTLIVLWQEGRLAHKRPVSLIPIGYLPECHYSRVQRHNASCLYQQLHMRMMHYSARNRLKEGSAITLVCCHTEFLFYRPASLSMLEDWNSCTRCVSCHSINNVIALTGKA